MRRLPEALAAAGLPSRLAARWGGRVAAPAYRAEVDPKTGIRNASAIARYAFDLAGAIDPAIERGDFPLVLGGDCSILLGSLLALRRRGRHGLFFLDGHADFATPATSPSHGAAGMDLALATGRGPAELSDLGGVGPLVRDEDVVAMGFRDEDALPPAMGLWGIDRLREVGMSQSVRDEVARLRGGGVRGFWIHVDADVLDPSMMPAVDTPEPGGLTLSELEMLLRELVSSDLAVGMQFCIFDPDLDPAGEHARALVDLLAGALSPS